MLVRALPNDLAASEQRFDRCDDEFDEYYER